jgi:hypothetical protein
MKTFKHSGDLGDIIYSLPTIKDLGGGVLYLDINKGADDEYCKQQCITKFNQNSYNFIYPLLKAQKYIEDVRIYSGENVDYNLNKMRLVFTPTQNRVASRTKHACLIDLHRQAFDLPEYDVNQPWLECGEPITFSKKVIVSRSPRYQSNWPFFSMYRHYLSHNAIFVGLKKEHELFEWSVDTPIEFFDVENALNLAKVIMGSDLLISNPTFALSVGMGLPNKNIIQEFDKNAPTTMFPEKQNMKKI